MLQRGQKIIAIARAVQEAFTTSEWTEIGYITGTDDYIDAHPRLLRSLSWGDGDYKGHVIDAVAVILDRSPDNLRHLVQYQPIAEWLARNDAGSFEQLQEEVAGGEVEHVLPATTTDAGLAALADAQALLRTRGPSSAVDRVHTGLHASLKAACDQAGIEYPPDASANAMLRRLLDHHPALADLGPRTDEIRRVIQTSANIVDAMGTLRNRVTLAHPNEELMGNDEALLVINVARSILRFLDTKLSARPR